MGRKLEIKAAPFYREKQDVKEAISEGHLIVALQPPAVVQPSAGSSAKGLTHRRTRSNPLDLQALTLNLTLEKETLTNNGEQKDEEKAGLKQKVFMSNLTMSLMEAEAKKKLEMEGGGQEEEGSMLCFRAPDIWIDHVRCYVEGQISISSRKGWALIKQH